MSTPTLYQELEALAATSRTGGYLGALVDVMRILESRGFTEEADAGSLGRMLAVEVALQSIIDFDNNGDGARSFISQRGCVAKIKAIARGAMSDLRAIGGAA